MHLKQLRSLAASGRVSRREFMHLAIAAGMTLPAAVKMYSTAAQAEP
jgi:peptide/nickel transport system substrate-binding protein